MRRFSASDFFSDAITKWGKSLKTDQGDDGKFNSCDLQIGKGELAESSSTVAFPTMTHAMGLAHVKLGKRTLHNRVTTYISNNNFGTVDPYTWGSNIAYASSEVDGRKVEDDDKRITLFAMQPMPGGNFRQEILGYSLMNALGISAKKKEKIYFQ